jgi:putative ABC transport system permease protein
LTNADYDLLWEQFSQIENLSGKYFLRGSKTVTFNGTTRSYSVQATHPDGQVVETLEMLSGRFYNERDMKDLKKVAVIGQNVQQELFDELDPIGESIIVDGTSYKIIGVFYDKEGEQTMRRIYLPISTVQKVYSSFDKMDQLVLVTGDLSEEDMSILEASVKKTFSDIKRFDPNDREAIRIYNRARDYQSFMSLMNAIKGLMWFVGIFSIIAGVIGVSNIMLIIVKDRTKEIGIRKALGATPRSIVGMIFQESIFITSVAGYLGLAAGIGLLALLQGIESEFFRRPEVNIWIALGATLILVLAGAFAGLLPAIQAARINPVTAIKSD